MGYPFGKKEWKVYDLETGDLFVSRDVVFYEDKFPYESMHKSCKDLMPPKKLFGLEESISRERYFDPDDKTSELESSKISRPGRDG